MKKRILAVLILAFLLAGCAGPAHPSAQDAPETEKPMPETPAESAQPTVEPEKPDVEPEPDSVPNAVDLYFPSNPTTGYEWTAEIEDPAVVELDEKYFDDWKPGVVGAGGVQWYRIRGASEGITSVTFRYARSWENTALTTYVYRLQVDARGSVLIWGVEVDGA
jgi:predicted secreted protein